MKTNLLIKAMLFIALNIIFINNTTAQDADGDGVLDTTETVDGTDPNDPCDYLIFNMTLPNIAGVDCDGDGVLDATELANGTDPQDRCDYNVADITLAGTDGVDCDGDGVEDVRELVVGTDPHDSCDYNLADITVTPTVFCNGNTITGSIKLDTNANGCDASDLSIANILVTSTNGTQTFSTFTDNNGNFIQNTNAGNFTTTIAFPNTYTVTPGAYSSTFVGSGNTDNVDFCITNSPTINDVNITVIPVSNAVPNTNLTHVIIYKNVGTSAMSGNVQFQFDTTKLSITSATESYTQAANILTFAYANLAAYETRVIILNFNVSATLGDILPYYAQIDPIGSDNTPADNVLSFTQTVSSSLNRGANSTLSSNVTNDIIVLEGNQIEIVDTDEFLHYVLRFRNTGTTSISNIVVTNKLDEKLDWSTLELEHKSHVMTTYILNENQLSFVFNNINLPDSTTDEANSYGYIAYKIKPKSNVAIGDVITNNASIYFDLEPVVQTNTVSTTIVNTASINDNQFNDLLLVYPNPTKNSININAKNTQVINVSVYSNLGQLVLNKTANNINKVNLESLSKGLYFIKLKDNKGNVAIKKVVLE